MLFEILNFANDNAVKWLTLRFQFKAGQSFQNRLLDEFNHFAFFVHRIRLLSNGFHAF